MQRFASRDAADRIVGPPAPRPPLKHRPTEPGRSDGQPSAAVGPFTLRPIQPDDADRLLAFVRGLSYGARYFRYGRGDYDTTEEAVRGVCTPDPGKCIHYVALAPDGDRETIVGSARIVFMAGSAVAELAISVSDEWQARGVGRRLVDALVEGARGRGIAEVRARILGTNTGMIAFMRRRGFAIEESPEGDWLKVAVIHLAGAAAGGPP
ncbi:MAG: GNAT family N-acetyltransferase [Burkholderiales bacterium]